MTVLYHYANPRAISITGIEATVIPRIVDAGFVLALALNAGDTAAERRLGAEADVGVFNGQSKRSTALSEGAGVLGVIQTA